MRYYATTRNFTALRDKVIKALFRQAFFLSVINFRYIQPTHNGFVKPLNNAQGPQEAGGGKCYYSGKYRNIEKEKGMPNV